MKVDVEIISKQGDRLANTHKLNLLSHMILDKMILIVNYEDKIH